MIDSTNKVNKCTQTITISVVNEYSDVIRGFFLKVVNLNCSTMKSYDIPSCRAVPRCQADTAHCTAPPSIPLDTRTVPSPDHTESRSCSGTGAGSRTRRILPDMTGRSPDRTSPGCTCTRQKHDRTLRRSNSGNSARSQDQTCRLDILHKIL